MNEIILQKSNFRCRENIYIFRPLRCLRRQAIEYVKNNNCPRRYKHIYTYVIDKNESRDIPITGKKPLSIWMLPNENGRVT